MKKITYLLLSLLLTLSLVLSGCGVGNLSGSVFSSGKLVLPVDHTTYSAYLANQLFKIARCTGDDVKTALKSFGVNDADISTYNHYDELSYMHNESNFYVASAPVVLEDGTNTRAQIIVFTDAIDDGLLDDIKFDVGDGTDYMYKSFAMAAVNITTRIQNRISPDKVSKDTPIIITGFGRGAAIANVFSSLYREGNLYSYCFACPYIGGSDNASNLERLNTLKNSGIFNINYADDIFTHLPISYTDDLGYRYGNDIILGNTDGNQQKVKDLNKRLSERKAKNSNIGNSYYKDLYSYYETKISSTNIYATQEAAEQLLRWYQYLFLSEDYLNSHNVKPGYVEELSLYDIINDLTSQIIKCGPEGADFETKFVAFMVKNGPTYWVNYNTLQVSDTYFKSFVLSNGFTNVVPKNIKDCLSDTTVTLKYFSKYQNVVSRVVGFDILGMFIDHSPSVYADALEEAAKAAVKTATK